MVTAIFSGVVDDAPEVAEVDAFGLKSTNLAAIRRRKHQTQSRDRNIPVHRFLPRFLETRGRLSDGPGARHRKTEAQRASPSRGNRYVNSIKTLERPMS